MPSDSLQDLSFSALETLLEAEQVNPHHAAALFRAMHYDLHPALVPENFQRPLETWLLNQAPPLLQPSVLAETPSADGWTRKFLLGLEDGREVETVLMGFPGRFTVCLSTQVGCAMGCVFCATGQMGFVRQLTVGEIVAQANFVARYAREHHSDKIRNVVLMGMGEPLHNFDAVMAALDIITDTRGLGIGPSKVTISTVGHVPGILKLADVPKKYGLSVSLHGASDEDRGALIPINKRWPLTELMAACRTFAQRTGRRVFTAWTLIAGKNDSPEHAHQLVALLAGMDVHVNIIPLNPTDGYDGAMPDPARTLAFQQILQNAGIPSTVRQRRGIDVGAGCGQLRARRMPQTSGATRASE
jgi:23S rRNA (adenine2503-C2)-methyltransferase